MYKYNPVRLLTCTTLAAVAVSTQAAITGGYFNNSTGVNRIFATSASTAAYSADNSPAAPLVVVDNDVDAHPATGLMAPLATSLASVLAQNTIDPKPMISTSGTLSHDQVGTAFGDPGAQPDLFIFSLTSKIETQNAVLLSGPFSALFASGYADSFSRISFDTSQLNTHGQNPVLRLSSLALIGDPITETAEWRLREHDNTSGIDILLTLDQSFPGGTTYQLKPDAAYELELRWALNRPADALNTDTQIVGGAVLGLSDVAGVAIAVPEAVPGTTGLLALGALTGAVLRRRFLRA